MKKNSRQFAYWPLAGATALALGLVGLALAEDGSLVLDGMQTIDEPSPGLSLVRERALTRSERLAEVPLVRLDPFVRARDEQESSGAIRIGSSREVAATASSAALASVWRWTQDDRGSHAAIRLQSPDAEAVRLAARVDHLPAEAVLRVGSPYSSEVTEVSGVHVLQAIEANLDAGEDEDTARLFWMPLVEGDELRFEVMLPPESEPSQLEISLPELAHVWVLPTASEAVLKAGSAGCNIDVMCVSDAGVVSARQAVARMVYAKGGSQYLCSGALLNNTKADKTPYFLSANHCISSQSAASSLQTFWFYRSSSCNAQSIDSKQKTLSGGAKLLYNSSNTDTTLLQLNDAAPAGAVFAGWDASKPPKPEDEVIGIHHPKGDLQKISHGLVGGMANCESIGDGKMSCTDADASGRYAWVAWLGFGITEGGSSGSPLFRWENGNGRVIGQLYGGSTSCTNPYQDMYGRLDIAYQDGLQKWLSPSSGGTPPPHPGDPDGAYSAVYRFYRPATGTHFYTINKVERDNLIAKNPSYHYEGTAFQASKDSASGLNPVYRFYNATTRSHFYTIKKAERDNLIASNPRYKYEGIAWYARTQAGAGSSPMYRFYRASSGTHFYTIKKAERDNLIASNPSYKYEGTAYYAWPK